MKQREILGHIDCPSCGTAKGMRITMDKNDEPFGYCEAECSQQLRIGGDARRVRKFVERHPWAKAGAVPVPDTAPPSAAAPVTEKKPAAAPVTVTAPEPPKPKRAPVANPFDFLLNAGKA